MTDTEHVPVNNGTAQKLCRLVKADPGSTYGKKIRQAFWALSEDERRVVREGTDEEQANWVWEILGIPKPYDPNDAIEDAELEQQMPQEGGDYPIKPGPLFMDSGYVTVEEVSPAAKAAWERTKQSGDALRRIQDRYAAGETREEIMRHTKHAMGCFQAAEDDEPIFTLRAKDAFAPAVVAYWMMLVQNGTALVGMTDEEAAHFCEKIDDARHCIQAMVEWQRNNTHKIPD